jgi:hypothetical protein
MNSELNILNKHFKKMFPFVIEVVDFTLEPPKEYGANVLYIYMHVSPTHYCELAADKVNDLISCYLFEKSNDLLKSVLPEWDGRVVKFGCHTNLDKFTIFDGLDMEYV